MDQLRALIDAGQYAQVLERVRRTPAQPQALLLGAQAALNLGQSDLAREWLESLPPFEEASLEADRLSILGYAYHNLGYPDRYQQLAQQAVAIEQNAFTLLHLGRSLPPDRAMVILRESLVQARTPREEGNVAYVLARLCEQLGRFREGLAYASLAMLRDPDDPIRFLAYAGLILTSSDETFSPRLLKQLIAFTRHEEAMYRMVALHILADYQLAQAQLTQALRTSEQLQAQVGKDLWPLFAWQAVRICQRMGQRERALQVARAVESSELGDSNVQGMGYLALGQAHYPQPESVTYFERAQSHFQQINPAGALVARAFLAQLARQPLSQNDRDLVAQWSTALCDALPSGAIHEVRGYTLTTFGQVELRGA